MLEELPSSQSSRKGNWIEIIEDAGRSGIKKIITTHHECSECHSRDWQNGKSKFCYNCGADMRDIEK